MCSGSMGADAGIVGALGIDLFVLRNGLRGLRNDLFELRNHFFPSEKWFSGGYAALGLAEKLRFSGRWP